MNEKNEKQKEQARQQVLRLIEQIKNASTPEEARRILGDVLHLIADFGLEGALAETATQEFNENPSVKAELYASIIEAAGMAQGLGNSEDANKLIELKAKLEKLQIEQVALAKELREDLIRSKQVFDNFMNEKDPEKILGAYNAMAEQFTPEKMDKTLNDYRKYKEVANERRQLLESRNNELESKNSGNMIEQDHKEFKSNKEQIDESLAQEKQVTYAVKEKLTMFAVVSAAKKQAGISEVATPQQAMDAQKQMQQIAKSPEAMQKIESEVERLVDTNFNKLEESTQLAKDSVKKAEETNKEFGGDKDASSNSKATTKSVGLKDSFFSGLNLGAADKASNKENGFEAKLKQQRAQPNKNSGRGLH